MRLLSVSICICLLLQHYSALDAFLHVQSATVSDDLPFADTSPPTTIVETVGSPIDQPMVVLVQLRCSKDSCRTEYAWDDLEVSNCGWSSL